MKRFWMVGLALVVCAVAAGFGVFQLVLKPQMAAEGGAAISFTQPFTLTDMDGREVNERTFLGKPTLYFFGFTHCPDVCPTTLGAIAAWLKALGTEAGRLNVVFVSVDPARDTPETLQKYVTAFHPQIMGVTGTEAQLQAAAKEFMVYYAKVPLADGDYTFNHSAMVLMADKNGTFVGTLDAHDAPDEAVATLKRLISGSL